MVAANERILSMTMTQIAELAGGSRAIVSRVAEGIIGLPAQSPCSGEQGPLRLAEASQLIVGEGSE